MWESPINVIMGEMQTQIERDVFKAIQNVGIDVNKEELLKALQYDREQYSKGYSDGYEKVLDDFAERLKDSLIVNWRHFLRTDSNGFDWITTDAVHTHIDELVKQMKGENL